MNYLSSKETQKKLHICSATLMNWKNKGFIKYKVLGVKKFLYDIDSIDISSDHLEERQNIIYGRVSTTNQKKDLDNQIELIKNYCISNGVRIDNVFKDIASGLNEDRPGLNSLIDLVIQNKVNNIYITFKDRLTRFGFNYFKNFFIRFNTNIIVIDSIEDTNKTFQMELTEDLISIIHHYSTKLYSNRRKKFKEIEKIINSTDIQETIEEKN